MMGMYFFTSVSMTNILFEGWNTDSNSEVALASIISFIMTILFEGLKIVKSYVIARRTTVEKCDHRREGNLTSSQTELLSSLQIPLSLTQIKRTKMILFGLESALHLFNFFYGYMLMLLVMTYSVWFLLAVLLGSGLGFFLFNALGEHIVSKMSHPAPKRHAAHCCSDNNDIMREPTGAASLNSGREYEGSSLDFFIFSSLGQHACCADGDIMTHAFHTTTTCLNSCQEYEERAPLNQHRESYGAFASSDK